VAWGLGAGSASRKPLGYAIVGGVFFSTALTLFVVPCAYVLLDRLRAREQRDLGQRALEPAEAK
jgi:HAE1 family hydrophobic/amphiphilic exporter-1